MSQVICHISCQSSAQGRVSAIATTAFTALAGIGAAVAVIASPHPAQGQTFQQAVNGLCGSLAPCIGPAASGSGGQVEVPTGGQWPGISQRLRELQCEADKNANCLQPGGAAADTMPFEGLNLFVSTDYQNKNKDEAAEAGFNSNRAGFTVGLDSPMSWGVIGGALNYNFTSGDFDHNGGDFEQNSFGGLLYGSYYPSDSSFIDGVIGLAGKGYTIDRTVTAGAPLAILGKARGDTIGFEFQSSVSGGYDFTFDNFTIGPRAGIHYMRTDLASFSESGNALPLHYDEQVEDSLTSTLGFQGSVAISTSFGVVVPQVSAEYVHEFLNDRRTIHASSNGAPVDFVTDPPDRDYFNVGGGVVFVLPDGISPFLNYTAEVANRFEEVHTVTLGVRLEM